jgi:hypothetical protein
VFSARDVWEALDELAEAPPPGWPGSSPTGWVEDRYVEVEYPERFLVGMVLDGHHKLLAYSTERQPARTLLISRVDDSWGPSNNRMQ